MEYPEKCVKPCIEAMQTLQDCLKNNNSYRDCNRYDKTFQETYSQKMLQSCKRKALLDSFIKYKLTFKQICRCVSSIKES